MYIINIGLKTSLNHFDSAQIPQGETITAEHALKALENGNLEVLWHTVAQSNTEPTLIAGVQARFTDDGKAKLNKLNKVAKLLQQDCVAVFDTSRGEGHLIGDYAADWGAFNPEYFLLG